MKKLKPNTCALEVRDLNKQFIRKGVKTLAVNNISFAVKEGEIFGLLGPNGAGKSTTVNVLTGLLEANGGTVLYFGGPLNESMKNQIGVASAYSSVLWNLTVEQNLTITAKMYGMKDIPNRITILLKKFRIEETRKTIADSLSTGQRVRVNLCRALINEPKLLFLDEATAGLDPDIAAKVREEIKELGCTIIFTSHIMTEVEQLCDRVAFIKNGKIVSIETPKNLLRKHGKKIWKKSFCISRSTHETSPYQRTTDSLLVLYTQRRKSHV